MIRTWNLEWYNAQIQAQVNAQGQVQNQPQPQVQRVTVISGMVGSIKKFCLQEEWLLWMERWQYFAANNVPDEKKVLLFRPLLGSEG